jgi:hypothetical protein
MVKMSCSRGPTLTNAIFFPFGKKVGSACVRRAREQYLERLVDRVSSARGPQEQLRAGADAFFSFVEQDPDRWMVLFGGPAVPFFGALGDELTAIRFETIEGTAAVLRAAAPEAEPEQVEILAQSISGAAVQLGRWWTRNPSVPRERVVTHSTDFITNGVLQLLPEEGNRGGVA